MPAELAVNSLSKNFGHRQIFANLTFSVAAGSSLAVVGPSGCGKSTLLNIIGLLESPTSGSVMINGKIMPAISSSTATKVRRNQINYLFQSFALIGDKTALENAMLALHYTPLSKSDKLSQIQDLFDNLGLSKVCHEKVSTLSGGEQQRLALARCVLKPGDLILADEPTGALDRKLAQQVLKELITLQHDHNKTLVVVTHDPFVAENCDSTLHLVPGAA
ncbi:ABC transporter ATP-binding protein [Actinomyces trachealis]|uniref:ABC transporter ATP-binding protein n=1 Tax=Actinomyces trachealis TaxID=2763540 RepID=UPI0018C6256F|nr:ABC transporter ATP-binding protein [Actinomyces trachealis]